MNTLYILSQFVWQHTVWAFPVCNGLKSSDQDGFFYKMQYVH
uniref:Uncharacterized protein n=1 Tax=Anguilla anguilla TaxID=7936 RepID=A0A0E9Q6G5_ANGAN